MGHSTIQQYHVLVRQEIDVDAMLQHCSHHGAVQVGEGDGSTILLPSSKHN